MGSVGLGFSKLNRIQVGIFQQATDADRATGEGGHIGAASPGDDAADVVAVDLRAVGEVVTIQRSSIGVLQFDLEESHGRGREIDHKLSPVEYERGSDDGAFDRFRRGKPKYSIVLE